MVANTNLSLFIQRDSLHNGTGTYLLQKSITNSNYNKNKTWFIIYLYANHYKYSQTCVQRPPIGPEKCGCYAKAVFPTTVPLNTSVPRAGPKCSANIFFFYWHKLYKAKGHCRLSEIILLYFQIFPNFIQTKLALKLTEIFKTYYSENNDRY
jgi:hypothetical protein